LDGQLADVVIEIENSTLKAPFAGIVAARHVNQGSVVSAGMPIIRVVAADSLEAWIGLPVERAAEVRVGQQNGVTVQGRRFDGVVAAKRAEIDRSTRTRTVILSVDAKLSNEILPGAVVRMDLRRETEGGGFWLPLTSLMREARGLWSVYVVEADDDRAQKVSRRYVELTHLENDRALVRGTLDAGDLVISDGTHRVVPGQEVRAKAG